MNDLPELTEKQDKFVQYYFKNGRNASAAYRLAYDSNAKEKTVWEESSKLLKHPKVAPWIEHYKANVKEVFEEDIIYTTQDCVNELNSLFTMAIESRDKNGNPNVSAAVKIVESKGKLYGLFKDQIQLSGGAIVQMGEVKAGEQTLSFNIGADNDIDSSTDA